MTSFLDAPPKPPTLTEMTFQRQTRHASVLTKLNDTLAGLALWMIVLCETVIVRDARTSAKFRYLSRFAFVMTAAACFSLALASQGGCARSALKYAHTSYVRAVGPEFMGYVESDDTLTAEQKQRRVELQRAADDLVLQLENEGK